MRRPLILALVALAIESPPCSAQLVVQGIRDLDFGPVIQGIAATVTTANPTRSGQFYFKTPAIGTRIRIQFTLPTQLNGPTGATMPITFGTSDALAKGTAPASVPVSFNPNTTASFTMTSSLDANVWLGGRVTPAANQRVGNYSNTVVMTVTIF